MKFAEYLKEEAGTPFQVKLGGKWHDLKLQCKTLDEIADELEDKPRGADHMVKDLPQLWGMILKYHTGSSNSDWDLEDISDITIKDDVLRFKYSFTDREYDRRYKGDVSIMEG